MKVIFTEPFLRQFRKLPKGIKRKLEKQIRFLLENLHHPSLRAKKYDETGGVWQARVNSFYRFYFSIDGNTYVVLAVTKHPK